MPMPRRVAPPAPRRPTRRPALREPGVDTLADTPYGQRSATPQSAGASAPGYLPHITAFAGTGVATQACEQGRLCPRSACVVDWGRHAARSPVRIAGTRWQRGPGARGDAHGDMVGARRAGRGGPARGVFGVIAAGAGPDGGRRRHLGGRAGDLRDASGATGPPDSRLQLVRVARGAGIYKPRTDEVWIRHPMGRPRDRRVTQACVLAHEMAHYAGVTGEAEATACARAALARLSGSRSPPSGVGRGTASGIDTRSSAVRQTP